jgi:hypothetical protein
MPEFDNPFESLNKTGIASELIEALVERGLGTLPAREVAIVVVEQLLRHHPEWKTTQPPVYKLARVLRISPRRLQGILDDISYRDPDRTDQTLRRQLRHILGNAEKHRSEDRISIQIEDGLLRAFTKQLIKDNYGMVDRGFSDSIIRISAEQFAFLCASILPQDEAEHVLLTIRGAFSHGPLDAPESLAKQIVLEFSKKAAGKLGEKLVDLGFCFVTGGVSELPQLLNQIRQLIS